MHDRTRRTPPADHAGRGTPPTDGPPVVPTTGMAVQSSPDDADTWDAVSNMYDSCVLDNFSRDLNGVLTARLTEVCDRLRAAADTGSDEGVVGAVDFGCGTGKWLPELAVRCDQVLGIDFSIELLRRAHVACDAAGLQHQVQLLQRDLGVRWPLITPEGGSREHKLPPPAVRLENGWWPRTDVAICANVIMSPDPHRRHVMLENVARSLRPGGALLLLVPAAESVAVVRRRQSDWSSACAERGLALEPLPESELQEQQEVGGGRGGGIFPRAGVLQKHWRREELVSAVSAAGVGLQLESVERVEYPWWTEFASPPEEMEGLYAESAVKVAAACDSLGSPYPFDWLALCTMPRTSRSPEDKT